jgi:DNA-binding transcriptional LysR family regulator
MALLPLPTIDALRDLLVLVDKRGVAKAAEERNISQPTMTRHLKNFQLDEGGLDVLEKQGKSLVPTELGRLALPAIQELVQQYDHLMRYFEGVFESPQVVRIGAGSFAAEHYLPRVMADIYRKSVDWELRTSACRGRHRILRTAQGHFDLSIVTHDPTQIDTMVATKLGKEHHLEIEQIAVQPFCIIAQSTSKAGKELARFATRKTIPTEELTR